MRAALHRFGDPGPARIHGWMTTGIEVEQLDRFYRTDCHLLPVDPRIMPEGYGPPTTGLPGSA